MKYVARLLVVLAGLLMLPAVSAAQEVREYLVLPFDINGPEKYHYLSRGIQDMLISRLNWPEHLEPLPKDDFSGVATPSDASGAASVLSEFGADYLVWGSATIVEQQASLDVNVADTRGKSWSESAQVPLADLIPRLETISGKINDEIFGREQQAVEEQPKKEVVQRMNPGLVYNEPTANQELVLNPQFQYEGGTSTSGRIRSSSLDFAARGLVVDDLDNDGTLEMTFISEHGVHVFHYRERRFVPLAEETPSTRTELLNLNVIDLNRDGIKEICVSGMYDDSPNSYILNFEDGKLSYVAERLGFYLNVAKVPPTYSPTLVGQRKGGGKIFGRSVQEVVRTADGFDLGKGLSLPDKANVFNFEYLPESSTEYKIIVVNDEDHIQVYTKGHELLSESNEGYAGSSVGFEYKDIFPGFGKNVKAYTLRYYIPLRLVVTDLNRDDEYELLVNKNISVAANLFPGYRSFPQGEIHSLFWDGIGLNLAWKTRRIKGTVKDYGVKDVDSDGTSDLFVCVVTHPGPTGLADRKTYMVTYPLAIPEKGKMADN
jgi:hypothetical protein